MSERLIGAIVGAHGDNKGIILPPAVAPYQVVLVPILIKKSREQVEKACLELKSELKSAGIRVHYDNRDIRPGSKFYDWELRGVPLRLELGPRDLEKGEVTVVRRDTGERAIVKRDLIIEDTKRLLDSIQDSLLRNAEKMLQDSIINIDAIDEAKDKTGIFRMGWCGETECDDQIVQYLELNMLGTPIKDENYSGNCAQCGKPTEIVAYYAKSY
jgi:prolyl-tRNA synthetase